MQGPKYSPQEALQDQNEDQSAATARPGRERQKAAMAASQNGGLEDGETPPPPPPGDPPAGVGSQAPASNSQKASHSSQPDGAVHVTASQNPSSSQQARGASLQITTRSKDSKSTAAADKECSKDASQQPGSVRSESVQCTPATAAGHHGMLTRSSSSKLASVGASVRQTTLASMATIFDDVLEEVLHSPAGRSNAVTPAKEAERLKAPRTRRKQAAKNKPRKAAQPGQEGGAAEAAVPPQESGKPVTPAAQTAAASSGEDAAAEGPDAGSRSITQPASVDPAKRRQLEEAVDSRRPAGETRLEDEHVSAAERPARQGLSAPAKRQRTAKSGVAAEGAGQALEGALIIASGSQTVVSAFWKSTVIVEIHCKVPWIFATE